MQEETFNHPSYNPLIEDAIPGYQWHIRPQQPPPRDHTPQPITSNDVSFEDQQSRMNKKPPKQSTMMFDQGPTTKTPMTTFGTPNLPRGGFSKQYYSSYPPTNLNSWVQSQPFGKDEEEVWEKGTTRIKENPKPKKGSKTSSQIEAEDLEEKDEKKKSLHKGGSNKKPDPQTPSQATDEDDEVKDKPVAEEDKLVAEGDKTVEDVDESMKTNENQQ